MAVGRLFVVVGLACIAASVFAQTPLEQQLLSSAITSGNYLVDGTGVVYDETEITFYLNGTAIGSIPLSEAAKSPSAHGLIPVDGHDDTHTIDLTKGESPTGGHEPSDYLTKILEQLLDKPAQDDPLDKIIIGRKLKL